MSENVPKIRTLFLSISLSLMFVLHRTFTPCTLAISIIFHSEKHVEGVMLELLISVLICFLILPYDLEADTHFTKCPSIMLYVVKGQDARFVWDYHVDNRASEFDSPSPKWVFKDQTIGGDVQPSWNFMIDGNTCPMQFRVPIKRASRESNATLVIANVSAVDEGEYKCVLTLKNRTEKVSRSRLVVTEPPRFNAQPPEKITVIEKSNLNISCSAVGPPPPNVTWVNVTGHINLTRFNAVGTGYLYIPNIHRYQSGKKFKCLARNNPNQGAIESRTTTITVHYPPEFTKLPENTTITEGDPIFLHCQATGNPLPYTDWERENKVLRPGFKKYGNGTIVIPSARKNDAGKYICIAKNVFNLQRHNKTTAAFVTVRYQPSIVYNSSTHVVKEGRSVEMRCKADGYPKATIIWSKQSGSTNLHSDEWYNISSVKKSDVGTYTCTASNGIGTSAKAHILVTVQYKPTIDESASNTTASSWNGNTITLRCKYSDARPEPTWIWTKPNGENISSSEIQAIDKGSEVKIATGQDYGLYKCIAKNIAGIDEHAINVTQLYIPGPPNVSVSNIEASSVTLCWIRPVYDGGSRITNYQLDIKGVDVSYSKSYNISEPNECHRAIGLKNNKTYKVTLYAKNVVGMGPPSSVTLKTKLVGMPAAPDVTASFTEESPLSLRLIWSEPFDNGAKITQYAIYKKTVGEDNEWRHVSKIYGSPLPLTYTVKNLVPGTTYRFIVTATNQFGESVKDDSKAKEVTIPFVTTTTGPATLAPIDGSKDKRSEPSDPNQPIIIAGAVVAVVLILVTVIISVIILKKKNIFGKGKRKSARTENAAYHNDVHSDDSSGRQAAAIDLGDASATYAAVDTSKKTKNKPKEIATYAAVDKSKKKKKPGEIIYAELADFNTNYTPAENRPVKYLETDYADISQFQNQSEPEPTYANFPGRSKDYANVSDI